TMRSPQEILARFSSEQSYVERYMGHVFSKAGLRHDAVWDVARTLEKHKLPSLPTRRDWRMQWQRYTAEEAAKITAAIAEIRPKLEAALREAENQVDARPQPPELDEVDQRSTLGEWITHLMEALEQDDSPGAIEFARDEAVSMQQQARQ